MLYKNLVSMVTRGTYDRESLMGKLDIYLLNNRLTEVQYQEIISLMGEKDKE